MGYMFEYGKGIAKDRAIRWCRLAAAQGDAYATATLKRLGA
jgi:TPR repeat protein